MEIVAPAGEYSKLEAAILGGANSVYLGLKGFGARRKAGNFTLAELKRAIDFAHLYNVRVYLTLNTIFRDREIEALYENVKTIYEYGIDAFIVQDLGMMKFLKENFPEAELHGSTQMTVSNAEEAEYLKGLGLKRIVLSRELSFEEIKSIKEQVDIDLEIFVSGALCVSYSGNCYLSSFVGGRSGNRGMCAQPCRKKYKSNNNEDYFFSPKDQLMSKKEIELLNSIGVESIKVEGRMKSEEYVYETVSYYRDLIKDNYTRDKRVEKIFNRGYSKGYFYGENTGLMNTRYSFDLGYEIGRIKGNKVKLKDNIKLGDGIVFLDKKYTKLSGSYLNKIVVDGNSRKEAEKGEEITLKGPKGSYFLYKNFDKESIDIVKHELKQYKRQEAIEVKLFAHKNEKIKLYLSALGHEVEVEGQVLEVAKKPAPIEKLREKLSELGETPFYAAKVEVDYDAAFIPMSLLKELRRNSVEKLKQVIVEGARRNAPEKWILDREKTKGKGLSTIVAVVREEWQKELLHQLGIDEVYLKNPDVAKEANKAKINLDNPLAGSLYQLLKNKNDKVILDWNQNITNSYALYQLKNLEKLEIVCISPELKAEDLGAIEAFGIQKEIVIYGRLRAMYIEKELEETTLVNEQNDKLLVVKNNLGNTEVYHKQAMNLIPKLDYIKSLGFDRLRLEFTFEDKDEIIDIIDSLKSKKGIYTPYNFEVGVY